jgi:hypothetical protein
VLTLRCDRRVIAVLIALGAAAYWLLPNAHCCDKPDEELEALTSAARGGQLDAIRALLERAGRDGIPALEEYWALDGALRGDASLRAAYVGSYRTRFTAEQQKLVLSRINEERRMPAAACLLSTLSGSPQVPSPTCVTLQ